VRTTININDELLAEAKLIAARQHRTIGSVLEDALRKLIDDATAGVQDKPFTLPRFETDHPGLLPGVDLYDREQMAELLGDNVPARG
jgi:hypothetical protein